MRGLFGVQAGNTVEVELVRADLFSSRASARLLVYGDDFNKAAWSAEHLRRIRCALADLATRFQADGRTVFMTALAPDKSSAYRPWARDPARLPAERLGELFDGLDVPDARLDLAIRRRRGARCYRRLYAGRYALERSRACACGAGDIRAPVALACAGGCRQGRCAGARTRSAEMTGDDDG